MDNQKNQDALFSLPEGNASLPNATAVLVLGIISIVGCWCYGVIGIICGIIALVLYRGEIRRFRAAPGSYTRSSYNNLIAGRVCAIIGLVLSLVMLIFIVYVFAVIGYETLQDPEALRRHFGR